MYDYAIQGYEGLITYPSAKGRDTALFRLSHGMLGNDRDGYERLLREFHEGRVRGARERRVRKCARQMRFPR